MNTRKQVGWLVFGASLALVGCGAEFVDERSRSFEAPEGDSKVGGVPDARSKEDAPMRGDDSAAQTKDEEAGSSAALLASGMWEGRKGYTAEGAVELVRDESGKVALHLDEKFTVSGVPAPVVVLSAREALGPKLEPQDLHLGELRSNSGAQQYALPSDSAVEDLRYAWIYCEPFGIEVARAELTLE